MEMAAKRNLKLVHFKAKIIYKTRNNYKYVN